MKFLDPVAIVGAVLALLSCSPQPVEQDGRLASLAFTAVQMNEAFWSPRIETNRAVTIPAKFQRSAETGRISNFARAGTLENGPHQGNHYDDLDAFKIIEGASCSLSQNPDPELASPDGLETKPCRAGSIPTSAIRPDSKHLARGRSDSPGVAAHRPACEEPT